MSNPWQIVHWEGIHFLGQFELFTNNWALEFGNLIQYLN